MKKRPVGRPRKYKTPAERYRAYRKRRKRSVHFRGNTDLWETLPWLFNQLDAEFGFTLDVCALPSTAKCDPYFAPDQDGLLQDWGQAVAWCNSPYGRVIEQWIAKAYEASKAGATVVCLIPSRSDTGWWHDYLLPYAEIRYLRRRIRRKITPPSSPQTSAHPLARPPLVWGNASGQPVETDDHGAES